MLDTVAGESPVDPASSTWVRWPWRFRESTMRARLASRNEVCEPGVGFRLATGTLYRRNHEFSGLTSEKRGSEPQIERVDDAVLAPYLGPRREFTSRFDHSCVQHLTTRARRGYRSTGVRSWLEVRLDEEAVDGRAERSIGRGILARHPRDAEHHEGV